MASHEECNALKPIMRGHDNQRELVAAKTEDSSEIRYQSKPIGLVVSSCQSWACEKTIKYSGRPRRLKEPSSSSNPQSDITSEEHLKILLRILPKQHSQLLLYFTLVNSKYMFTLNQSKKRTAHDHLVRTFGELFLWYEETRNTSGQYWVLHSAKYLGITYVVCRFVSTGVLPFEELIDSYLVHD